MATPSAAPASASDSDHDIHVKEWEKARDVLAFFDGKLHDLRMYGFSIVTALLTADGVLLSSATSGGSPAIHKFAVCAITLVLILALFLIDTNYVVFQKAAATRALVVEKKLNIELSEIISDRYRADNIENYIRLVYGIFTISILFLGMISLGAQFGYTLALLAIAVAGTLLIQRLRLEYKYNLVEDWTISPLVCSQDSCVEITLNNLCTSFLDEKKAEKLLGAEYREGTKIPIPIQFGKGKLLWDIINEETGKVTKKFADRDMNVFDSKTWILKGGDIGKAGIYELRPRDWPLPLRRRIVVSADAKQRHRGKEV
jgi:hypothetical protein